MRAMKHGVNDLHEKVDVKITRGIGAAPLQGASVGIGGGYLAHGYRIGDSALIRANHAYPFVLMSYLGESLGIRSMEFDVQPTCSIATMRGDSSEVLSFVEAFISVVSRSLCEKAFVHAKESALAGIKKRYKDESYRATLKAQEALRPSAGFSLKDLLDDFEVLDYGAFCALSDDLLCAGNTRIRIVGDMDIKLFEKMPQFSDADFFSRPTPVWLARQVDPYLLQDVSVVARGREGFYLDALAISFESFSASIAYKRFVVDLLTFLMGLPSCFSFADRFDAGIVFSRCSPGMLDVPSLGDLSAADYSTVQRSVVLRYVQLLLHEPALYSALSIDLAFVGLDVDEYVQFAESCSFDSFRRILADIDPFVRGVHVVVEGRRLDD